MPAHLRAQSINLCEIHIDGTCDIVTGHMSATVFTWLHILAFQKRHVKMDDDDDDDDDDVCVCVCGCLDG